MNISTTKGLIRVTKVLELIPFGKSTLYEKIASGDFPAPIKISSKIVAWKIEDVMNWIEDRSSNGEV